MLVSVAVDVTVFGGFGEVVVSVEKTVERTVVLEIVVETLFVVEVVVRVLTTCFGPAATRKATATPSPSASAACGRSVRETQDKALPTRLDKQACCAPSS